MAFMAMTPRRRIISGLFEISCGRRTMPPEESTPVGGGGQKAAFAGQVAGVPGGVAAEGGQGLIDVVDDQRQGAQGEKEHGNDHPAERSHTNNLSGKN